MWSRGKLHASEDAGLVVQSVKNYWVPDGGGSFARDIKDSLELLMQGGIQLNEVEEAYIVRPDGRLQRFFGDGIGSNILRSDSKHFNVIKNPDILLPLEELTELERQALKAIEEAEAAPVAMERSQALYNWCCFREECADPNTFEGAVERAHARSMVHFLEAITRELNMPPDWKRCTTIDEVS
uniref:Nudix hydrolase domain-containing protein n=1 Tax=Steinernema glaseri TaxID=37863 RepID=A0A1I7Y6I3_9BILA